jgi:hypothetical protein
VPVLNGVQRLGTGRRGGDTRCELRWGPDTMVGGSAGAPVGCVPAQIGESES